MEEFFSQDPLSAGSKGLVFIGTKLLLYRRDTKTNIFPLFIDLPGGGPNDGETPFDTFKREVYEEFGLTINPKDIDYVKKYQSKISEGKTSYFPVAHLPQDSENKIVFGDEGIEYFLLDLDKYLKLNDAWPIFQERAAEYAGSLR